MRNPVRQSETCFLAIACLLLATLLPCAYADGQQPGVLGPYVSWIETVSPTIMLHTKVPAEATLTLVVQPGSTATTLRSKGRHHQFELPEAIVSKVGEIEYTVAVNGLDIGTYDLKIIDRNVDAFSFAVVGDAQNAHSPRRRTIIMAALEEYAPAFILHTGDLHVGKGGQRDSDDIFGDDWRINFFDPMSPLQSSIAFFPVFGNHDDEIDGQRAAFNTAFPKLPPEGRYSFSMGGAAFFFLDIQHQIREFFQKGHAEWIKAESAKYPSAVWRIAVFHVSPWSGGHRGEREWTVGRREEMLDVLQSTGIDLVFCGHDHNYQRLKPLKLADHEGQPVQIVITGLAGSSFYNAEKKDYTAVVVNRQDHFCVVDVEPEHITVRAINADGIVIDEFRINRSRTETEVLYEVHATP